MTADGVTSLAANIAMSGPPAVSATGGRGRRHRTAPTPLRRHRRANDEGIGAGGGSRRGSRGTAPVPDELTRAWVAASGPEPAWGRFAARNQGVSGNLAGPMSSNVNGADRFRRQCRWPSVRPELLRLAKRGTNNNCQRRSSLSPPDLQVTESIVSREAARGRSTAARQQKRRMTAGKTADGGKDRWLGERPGGGPPPGSTDPAVGQPSAPHSGMVVARAVAA